MKIYLDSLGCPKNLVDAERMAAELEQHGNHLIQDPENADAIVVNTCAFIEDSKRESINAILEYAELKKTYPNLRLIVSGCLSERYQESLKREIPEIDSMIGVRNPQKIVETLQVDTSSPLDKGSYEDFVSSTRRVPLFSSLLSTYLKVSEGCHRKCSFCAIPSIRGPLRSRSAKDILTEASILIENGFQELILVAEDTTAYGLDKGQRGLVDLLKQMDELPLTWIRLLYLFPDASLIEIAEEIANSQHICHYIDIPLQHVSSELLSRMNRPGNGEDYLAFIKEIRKRVPDIAIRSAFIVGHPGETEDDHAYLKNWLQEARLNRVGFFAYSSEESTPSAYQEPKVPHEVALQRIEELASIQAEISTSMLAEQVGKTLKCINEGKILEMDGKEYLALRSEYDAPEIDGQIFIPYQSEDQLNTDFFDVRISDVYGNHDLLGREV